MTLDLAPIVPYVLGGGLLATATALVRWGFKVDRSLSAQAVVNEKTVGALNTLAAQLAGADSIANTRIEDLERRMTLAEGPVASNGQRRHARKRDRTSS